MANASLINQLNEAVEAIIADPGTPLPQVSQRIAAQLRIAAELRALPRPDFKARLKEELMKEASGSATSTKPVREAFHTVTPYLTVEKAPELIEFVKQAFGAEELLRTTGTGGGIHAEVRIGDSIVMIGGGGDWRGNPMPTGIHVYVNDADAVYNRAVQAGAAPMYAPMDQPYGDREAGVKDLSGNHWYIGTHKGAAYIPKGLRAVTPVLHPRGAAQMIDFLERAFGAEEQSRAQSPDGVIHHATVRIGDSMIEMGEAHGEWQPMATMFYLYVDDVDSWYRRALEAGATSRSEPADQSYGDRVAGVADPFENIWYLGTPIGLSQRRDAMTSKVKPIPEGYHTATPYLIAKDAAGAIEFYKTAFGATVLDVVADESGVVMHGEFKIGDSPFMITDEHPDFPAWLGPQSRGGTPVHIYLYVEDADAVFNRAIAAGAKELLPMKDQFYGDRSGALTDPFGHIWYIATHIEDVSQEEIQRRAGEKH